MDTPREFFETLESRVDPAKAAGLTASYRFEIDGAGNWMVDVDDGKVSVSESDGDADHRPGHRGGQRALLATGVVVRRELRIRRRHRRRGREIQPEPARPGPVRDPERRRRERRGGGGGSGRRAGPPPPPGGNQRA